MSPSLEETINIRTVCPGCQTVKIITCSLTGYQRWKDGELIQRALPELRGSERESLITGYCDPCWDKFMMPPDEEEAD